MSIYDDRFSNHTIHENIKQTKIKLENLISDFKDSIETEHLNRILGVFLYAESRLDNLDSSLVPINILNQIDKLAKNINTDLTNFENSKDQNQLESATTKADNVLTQIQQLPKFEISSELENLPSYISKLKISIDSIIKKLLDKKEIANNELISLNKQIEKNKNDLKNLSNIIETQKARLDTAITEFQKQFSEAEDRRRETFDNKVKEYDGTVQQNIKSLQQDINSFKNEKKDIIDKTVEEYKNKTNNNIELLNKKIEEIIKDHQNNSEETIKYLENTKAQAAKLLNIISNIGVTGNYNKIANQERRTANWLRGIAIVFMIIGIVVISEIVFKISTIGFDWKLLLSRVGVTLVILIPAFYLVKESANHRKNEIRNRKMELELASINPYLELLPEKEKIELKSKLTEKFFGQSETLIDGKETVTTSSLFELLEKVLVILSKRFK